MRAPHFAQLRKSPATTWPPLPGHAATGMPQVPHPVRVMAASSEEG